MNDNQILGVKIENVSFRETLEKVRQFLNANKLKMIATVNPEIVMQAQKEESYKNILNNADLSVPDGFGLKIAAWFLGKKVNERITGVDLTWEIVKIAAETGKSVYLLGGVSGVPEKTSLHMKLVHPELNIAGTATPEVSFDGKTDQKVIDDINNTKADILLVAFGAPKQEKFIANYKDKLNVKLAIGVGGTFDYIAQNIPYAPKWMRQIGLEWLYRLFTQPKRFNRIITATIRFPWAVFVSKFRNE